MSIEAIAWVFDQDIRPSSVKFVLLALADNAGNGNGQSGVVWPSLPEIIRKTSQDRKTVISAIDELERLGFLADTGRRTGATNQVKVYRIVGLPSGEHHYVYKLTHRTTGEYYFGVRSSPFTPEKDDYWGSGAWPQRQLRSELTKQILAVQPTRAEAESEEIRLIRGSVDDELCQNKVGKGKNTKNGTVPFLPLKGTVFPSKEYRKRDTEPSVEPLGESSQKGSGPEIGPGYDVEEEEPEAPGLNVEQLRKVLYPVFNLKPTYHLSRLEMEAELSADGVLRPESVPSLVRFYKLPEDSKVYGASTRKKKYRSLLENLGEQEAMALRAFPIKRVEGRETVAATVEQHPEPTEQDRERVHEQIFRDKVRQGLGRLMNPPIAPERADDPELEIPPRPSVS